MLVDEEKYYWLKWRQPVFTDNETWGCVSASSVEGEDDTVCEPFYALDGDESTTWKGGGTSVRFIWEFESPLKIYLMELVNGDDCPSHTVEVYADIEMAELMAGGELAEGQRSVLALEPDEPFCCDTLVLNMTSPDQYVGLSDIQLTAEVGEEKTVLLPFLNTSEDMEYISNGFNDDGTYQTVGVDWFKLNGVMADPVYVSSNHWLGFGRNTEQLKILRRDGCSTAILRQLGMTGNGLEFLKIRFEGYTVYNNRVEANRLIFELFLLSNNDTFLNVVQTPTSGNTGVSELICNGKTIPLTLFDGIGGGAMVSFYHKDGDGNEWDVVYSMYGILDTFSSAYLIRQGDAFYTLKDDELMEVPMERLTAAMFLKYGIEEMPGSKILTPMENPQVYFWKVGGKNELLKAAVKAYPYPQILYAVARMGHTSILGIKMMTAQFSGDVGVSVSIDDGETYSDEVPLSDWLNTDPMELYESLGGEMTLYMRFVLHENATLSRFKITYIN